MSLFKSLKHVAFSACATIITVAGIEFLLPSKELDSLSQPGKSIAKVPIKYDIKDNIPSITGILGVVDTTNLKRNDPNF
ncbi:hypothetical protein [Dyadobacter sp. LHD-138]|uniref:hypothetical protein n=1 Tax=Dyadobacter sp. LHD-138 TaxID=3071413 RepID=UPI0027DED30E|nr:hypothetical protein [Dyadobacter sp. LHD-138]MDQ6482169.1 hypothetical protein [Dyadobacter sp. LHD-138]